MVGVVESKQRNDHRVVAGGGGAGDNLNKKKEYYNKVGPLSPRRYPDEEEPSSSSSSESVAYSLHVEQVLEKALSRQRSTVVVTPRRSPRMRRSLVLLQQQQQQQIQQQPQEQQHHNYHHQHLHQQQDVQRQASFDWFDDESTVEADPPGLHGSNLTPQRPARPLPQPGAVSVGNTTTVSLPFDESEQRGPEIAEIDLEAVTTIDNNDAPFPAYAVVEEEQMVKEEQNIIDALKDRIQEIGNAVQQQLSFRSEGVVFAQPEGSQQELQEEQQQQDQSVDQQQRQEDKDEQGGMKLRVFVVMGSILLLVCLTLLVVVALMSRQDPSFGQRQEWIGRVLQSQKSFSMLLISCVLVTTSLVLLIFSANAGQEEENDEDEDEDDLAKDEEVEGVASVENSQSPIARTEH